MCRDLEAILILKRRILMGKKEKEKKGERRQKCVETWETLILKRRIPYGLVRRSYLTLRDPQIWGSLKIFAGIMHIWYKIVPKTQFRVKEKVLGKV